MATGMCEGKTVCISERTVLCVDSSKSCPAPFLDQGATPSSTGYWDQFAGVECSYSMLSLRAQTGGWPGNCTVAAHVAKRWGGAYNSTWCTTSCSPGATWHPACVTHADDVEWAALEAYEGIDDKTEAGRDLDPMSYLPGEPDSPVFCQCRCHPDILPRTERIPPNIIGDLVIYSDSRSTRDFAHLLGHVRSITGRLRIRNCSSITSLSFLRSVAEIAGGIEIWYNDNLTSLGGFNPVYLAGGISTGFNAKLPAASTLVAAAANSTGEQMGACCFLSAPWPQVGEYTMNSSVFCDTNTPIVLSRQFQQSGDVTTCKTECDQWADCVGFNFNATTGGCTGVSVCMRRVDVPEADHYYEKVTIQAHSGRDWNSNLPQCTKKVYIPDFASIDDNDLSVALEPGMVGCCPSNSYPNNGGGCTECAAWDTTPAGQTTFVRGAFSPPPTVQCQSFFEELKNRYVLLAWAVGADSAHCIVSPGCDASWLQTENCNVNHDWYTKTCGLRLPCTDNEFTSSVLAIDSGNSARVENLDLSGTLALEKTHHRTLFQVEAVQGRADAPPSPYTGRNTDRFYARLRKNWADKPDECLTLHTKADDLTFVGFRMEPCSTPDAYDSQVFLFDHSDGAMRTTFHLLLNSKNADSVYLAIQPTHCNGFISGTSVIAGAAQPLSEREQRWRIVMTEVELQSLDSATSESTVTTGRPAGGTIRGSTTVGVPFPANAVVVVLVYNILADEVFSSLQSELDFKESIKSSLVAVGVFAEDILQIELRRVSATVSTGRRRASGDTVEADVTVRNQEAKTRVEEEGNNGNIQTYYKGRAYQGMPKESGDKDDGTASSSLAFLSWFVPIVLVVLILAAAAVGMVSVKRRRNNMYGFGHDSFVCPINRNILDEQGFHPVHYAVVLGDVAALKALLMPRMQQHTDAISLHLEQSRRISGPFPRLSQLSIDSKISSNSVQLPRFSEGSIDAMQVGETEIGSTLEHVTLSHAVPGLPLLDPELPSLAKPVVPQLDRVIDEARDNGTLVPEQLSNGVHMSLNAEVPDVPQTLLGLTPDIQSREGLAPALAAPMMSNVLQRNQCSSEGVAVEPNLQDIGSLPSKFQSDASTFSNVSNFRSAAFSSVRRNNPLTAGPIVEGQYNAPMSFGSDSRMDQRHHNSDAPLDNMQAIPDTISNGSLYAASPTRVSVLSERRQVMPNTLYDSEPQIKQSTSAGACNDIPHVVSDFPTAPRASVVFDPTMADLALLDVRDLQGNTPTMWAVRAQKLNVLEFLIEHGADASAANLERVGHPLQHLLCNTARTVNILFCAYTLSSELVWDCLSFSSVTFFFCV